MKQTKTTPDSKEGLHTQDDTAGWIAEQMLSGKSMPELIVSYSNERKALTDELGTAYNKIEDLKEILETAEFNKKKLEDERKALLDALESLAKAYDLKMGKSALQLRIDLAKDAINNAKNI